MIEMAISFAGWLTAIVLILFAATVVISLFVPGWFAADGTKRPKS